MRLFVAICFSDEIKALLSSVCQKLKTQSLSGNFTRPENLHMTLAFIGESNRVAAVKSAMQQCTGAPFKLSLSGVGRFGDLWWVGIEKIPRFEPCRPPPPNIACKWISNRCPRISAAYYNSAAGCA